jgi:hypothetical protein
MSASIGERAIEHLAEVVHQEVVVHDLGGLGGLGVLDGVEEGETGVAGERLVEADGVLDQRVAHALEALGG